MTCSSHLLRLAVGGCLALLQIGCATTEPEYPEAPPAFEAGEDYRYIIGPGDAVNIFVWRQPELSASVPVRPDGMITTPLNEDIRASGRTPTQLARDLEEALSTYVRNPIVTVIVTGFIGVPDEQVRIVGQAANPQALPYSEGMSVLDVMIAVGGLDEFAAGNKALIIRRESDAKVQYSVRLDDLVYGGDISANVDMAPGDVLIIPEAWF